MQQISYRWKHTIIVYGTTTQTILDGNILYIQCCDTYDGLSEKMMSVFDFILNSDLFNSFSHILKANDHDTYFTRAQVKDIKIKYTDILTSQDYIGQNLVSSQHLLGRTHHYGKVPINSIWYNKMFTEEYVPYLGGGETYILSIKSLSYLVNNKKEYIKFGSYDYVMVGAILNKYNLKSYELTYGIKTWRG